MSLLSSIITRSLYLAACVAEAIVSPEPDMPWVPPSQQAPRKSSLRYLYRRIWDSQGREP